MFSKYYMSELAYLREMGRTFGLANPSVAGLLVERGTDPDVERLLEGVAFLTARIRERVEDAIPEMVQGLTELLLPHFLRPLPSCSIVEFTPQMRVLRGRSRVAAGAELAARPVEGTSCLFRTTADLDLLPISVEDAFLDQKSVTSPKLRLSLQTHEQGRLEIFRPAGLRFFIHGELSTCAHVLLWLLRYCQHVEVRTASGAQVRLGPEAIQAVGFEREFPLLPWPRASDGYRLLQEYFTLPQKFMFFDVRGLDAAAHISEERFELIFQLERPPPLDGRVYREMFRPNCVPVINLFSTTAAPILHHALDTEHLLRASELPPHHMEVYSVDSVIGLRAGQSGRRLYRPFYEFAHTAGEEEEARFFRLRRTPSPVNDGIDTYLALQAPRDVAPSLGAEETLSLDLTCTNRSLPTELQVGDICQVTASSPTLARFKNIAPVTRPARAPLASELHWRLLSHLAIDQSSLADAASLRRLLDLYNFQALSDELAARANRQRINAVSASDCRPVTRFLEGAPLRGTRMVLDVEESRFTGPGDAYLFGAVLHEVLASNVTINSFNELVLRLQPSQTEYPWPPRNGSQPIL